jgi:hypothetical protein
VLLVGGRQRELGLKAFFCAAPLTRPVVPLAQEGGLLLVAVSDLVLESRRLGDVADASCEKGDDCDEHRQDGPLWHRDWSTEGSRDYASCFGRFPGSSASLISLRSE